MPGIDRTIRFCSPDILLPAPLLMRCLIDGPPWTRLVQARTFLFFSSRDSFAFIYISLGLHRRTGLWGNCHSVAIQSVK